MACILFLFETQVVPILHFYPYGIRLQNYPNIISISAVVFGREEKVSIFLLFPFSLHDYSLDIFYYCQWTICKFCEQCVWNNASNGWYTEPFNIWVNSQFVRVIHRRNWCSSATDNSIGIVPCYNYRHNSCDPASIYCTEDGQGDRKRKTKNHALLELFSLCSDSPPFPGLFLYYSSCPDLFYNKESYLFECLCPSFYFRSPLYYQSFFEYESFTWIQNFVCSVGILPIDSSLLCVGSIFI